MSEEPNSRDPKARDVAAQQDELFRQYEAATNAAWEVISPATTATGPGNLGDPDHQQETYRRAWLSARAAAPNFSDPVIARWVESQMAAAFGSYYLENDYNGESGLVVDVRDGLPARSVDPDLMNPLI